MSIGIRLHDTAEGTLAQRALYAQAQGFECAHLALSKTLGPAYLEPQTLTPGLAAQVRRAMNGLDVAVLGCYLNLATPNEEEYRQTLERYIAHLRFSRWLGAAVVGTETGNPNAAYRYEPQRSHTQEALETFVHRVRPVVEAAEKLGAILAIEPVYTHIVSTPLRARYALDTLKSPNVQIILDPVNLLHADNVRHAAAVIDEALEVLGPDIVVLHAKDYAVENGQVRSMAVGTGVMDYTSLSRFVREKKPGLFVTLEDTVPQNAQAAGQRARELFA